MQIGKITEWERKKESCLKVEKEFSVALVLRDNNTPITWQLRKNTHTNKALVLGLTELK